MSEVKTHSDFIIETARPGDGRAVADIQRQTWLATYVNEGLGITAQDLAPQFEGERGEQRAENWQRFVDEAEPHRAIYVAREEGRMVGYVMARISSKGRHVISSLYVLPEAQGKGIGARLMEHALAWLGPDQDVELEVVSYNRGAIDFYKRLGFALTAGDLPGIVLPNGKVLPKVEMVLPGQAR